MKQPEPSEEGGNPVALNGSLVEELKKTGCIQTARVEEAFRAVLRHHFVPEKPLEEVYSNRVILTKQDPAGRWISSSSQPAIMAIMLEQLDLQPGQRVLEIGAGTGYNAALMAHLVGETGQIVAVDIDEDLVEAAHAHLMSAGFDQVQVVCADGGYGYPDAAPFDRIILTVGAPDIAPAWWDQLKPDGRLVLPLTLKGSMKSFAFVRIDDQLSSVSVKDCGFMPLRGDFASKSSNNVQLSPDLNIDATGESSIDPTSTYDFLLGASKDWETNVEVKAWDVLNGGLWTWLALHEANLGRLVAEGDMVERNIVPPLIGIAGPKKYAATVALIDQNGVAALMRPPGQSLPLMPIDKLFSSDPPFALYVRQFGADDSLAQHLIAQIQTWDAAGRPSEEGMHIHVYRKDAEYTPSEREFVIQKPLTKLVVEWRASDAKMGGSR